MKKFILGLLLNIILILLPIALAIIGVTQWDGKPGHEHFYYWFIAAGACVLLYLMASRHILKLLSIGRQEVEYDEFGRSKRKGDFKRLSRKEQDAIDLQKLADTERILSQSAVAKMTKKGSANPQGDLNRMIGLSSAKSKVLEMSARMEFEQESNKKKKKKDRINSMSGRHMVFFGPPGTGKTTVARILAGFLYQHGYIKKNKIIEVDGNFLKSGADTAAKVKMITQYAYDGVLFIDEAYSLAEGAYGRDAVATLIKEMEDNRDRFICILAGYTKEMDRLLDSNTGFKSRIKEYIDFPDYSIPEMQEIFISMANEQGFAVSGEALERFQTRMANEKKLKTFGNGRTVRNVLDEVIDVHSLNYVSKKISENDRFRICAEDVGTVPKRDGIM